MLIAALPLYANGKKLLLPAAEVWGELCVGKDRDSGVCTARLLRFQSSKINDVCLPTMYEPSIRLIAKDLLDLRGMERVEDAWHLQLWSCRTLSKLELVMGTRGNGLALKGVEAVYLRSWQVLWSHAAEHAMSTMEVAKAVSILEVPVQEVYSLLEWATHTHRCHMMHGGENELGIITFKSLNGQMAKPT